MTTSHRFSIVDVARAKTASEGWEPLIVAGRPLGEIFLLHEELGVWLWRCLENVTYEYSFESAETFYVLEGEQRLTLENGETLVTGVGDCASFEEGLRCSVELKAPFLEILVYKP